MTLRPVYPRLAEPEPVANKNAVGGIEDNDAAGCADDGERKPENACALAGSIWDVAVLIGLPGQRTVVYVLVIVIVIAHMLVQGTISGIVVHLALRTQYNHLYPKAPKTAGSGQQPAQGEMNTDPATFCR